MSELKRGDRGALVEMLQLGLLRSGYLSGTADGIFGPKTEAALRRFQRNFGLEVTGALNADTWETLRRFVRGYFRKKVCRGDTFWSLAAQYGCTPAEIAAANPGVDPDRLQIGESLTVPFGYPVIPDDVAYSSQLCAELVDGLRARYPMLETETAGKSALGRELTVLRLGSGKKQLFAAASFHANEWINTPVLFTFAEDCLRALVNGKKLCGTDIGALLSEVTLHLLPMVNPDGVDLVTGALQSGAAFDAAKEIAARYPAVPFPAGWKANIRGVDLNLQFPAGWEQAKKIKYAQGYVSPAPRDYVGPAPLSAPESKAVADYTCGNRFRFVLAYHTQGSVIYWTYGDDAPPQNSEQIGRALSDASGYPLTSTPPEAAYAGYKDWFIREFDRPGYTVETGSGKNPLPLSQFASIYAANRPLLLAALKEAAVSD